MPTDTERMEWIEAKRADVIALLSSPNWLVVCKGAEKLHPTLRAAIDAAMGEEKRDER
jgi:hypothetical protein